MCRCIHPTQLRRVDYYDEEQDSKDQLAVHPEFVDLLAMNQTLMERWNRIVAPGDKVYVVSDFGNEEWMKLVNGEVQVVGPSVDGTPAGIRLI